MHTETNTETEINMHTETNTETESFRSLVITYYIKRFLLFANYQLKRKSNLVYLQQKLSYFRSALMPSLLMLSFGVYNQTDQVQTHS